MRTAALGQSKSALERDLSFLKRLWKEVRQRGTQAPTPSLVYQELDLSARAVRDYLTDDVAEVWVDEPETATKVAEMATLVFPRRPGIVKQHSDMDLALVGPLQPAPLHRTALFREVTLPSGGRLVFDQGEALTAVDINSEKSAARAISARWR